MKSKRVLLLAGLSLLWAPAAAFAHHALEAQFDTQRTITLTGTVQKMDWSNPHVRLYINVRESGSTATWEVDMGSPNMQLNAGWKIDTYRRGDVVRIDAYPARNGSNIAYGRVVKLLR